MTTIPDKPSNALYTDGQWRAIYDSGKNLLVSASAGSGKTTVLVERVIEKIKSGTNVNQLLVVTFTNAAAREMKIRIQEAVQEAIVVEKDVNKRRHLIAQIPLLPHANISTIHSFCLQIIRRYYYLIDLDPIFRPLTDETERLLLQEEAWENVREELYGSESESFFRLAEAFSNDRSDEGLTDLIYSLYFFAQANPQPKEWLEMLSDLYNVDQNNFTQSKLYVELLKPTLIQMLESIMTLVDTGIDIGNSEEDLKRHTDCMLEDLAHYQLLYDKVLSDQIADIYPFVKSFKAGTWPRKNKTMSDDAVETAQNMKIFRDDAKEIYAKELTLPYFSSPLSEHVERMNESLELIEEMAKVTGLFMDEYAQLKRSRKLVDFNDFEHLALNILTSKNEQGENEASNYYRDQFVEVMIDEYQDTNQTQEEILRYLTKPETEVGNRFMVGDVKQSIYAFRLADPEIFIDKYERYAEGKDGERIILAENFRSRKEVLDFTNLIFIQLMNKEVGQLSYDHSAELVNGYQSFKGEDSYDVELLIFEKEDTEDETADFSEDILEDLEPDFTIDTKTEGELLMVGKKIKEMIESKFELFDKKSKTMRPIQFRDIVLLTPTKLNNLSIQEIFKKMNIPVAVTDTQNYFRTTEISIMMSLLKIIDNPHQDIPLAAVLRSPIVGLDEEEMAMLRLANKQSDYYTAMMDFVEQQRENETSTLKEDKVFKKIDQFIVSLNSWREEARRDQLVALIWSIYQETGYLDYVGGMKAGKQRKANLHALYERAKHYEQTNFKGLFQFIRFIEKMQQKDKDLAEPASLSEDENAVRVMTIHGSKGLEFPVVFVMDLTKQLSAHDLRKHYVFDQEYGVGIDYKDLDQRVRYSTYPELLLKQEKKNLLRSEEMRVLYVALTRAEQKLFLVGSYKNESEAWKSWQKVAQHEETVLPDQLRLNAKSMMDWIGMSLIRHPKTDFTEFDVTTPPQVINRPGPFEIHFFKKEELYDEMETLEEEDTDNWVEKLKNSLPTIKSNEQFSELAQEAIELMNQNYQHITATNTTSYQSVSEIKRLFEEPQDGRMQKVDVDTPRNQFRYVEEELARPSFISELVQPSGAEIGQATHLLLQSLDLNEIPTTQTLAQQIADIESKGIFTKEIAKKIPSEKIVNFFQTDLGQFIVDHSDELRREVPFALLMEAKALYPDMDEDGEDKILVHGIIDGYIEEEDGLILFDYKTDQVKRFGDKGPEMMKKKYAGQLRLYRQALESILDKKVKETVLILLDTNELVSIE